MLYIFLTLFYISGLLLNFILYSCYIVHSWHFTAIMADQPQNVFNEGHICDQIVQGL